MIVGKDAGQVSVRLNSPGPVFLAAVPDQVQLRRTNWIRSGRRRGCFADVIIDLATVAHRIQGGDHSAAIGAFPNADIEGNADRSFLRRAWSAYERRRLPRG